MRNIKAIVSLLLCLALVLGMAPFKAVDAADKSVPAYVALGDSITTGFGLSSFTNGDIKNKTNPQSFVVKLGKKLGMDTVNLGVEGYGSTELLKLITNPSSQQKSDIDRLKKASLVTITVGGNNLLIPLISAVNAKLGSGKSIYTSNASEIQTAVLGLLFDQTSLTNLENALKDGVLKFTGDAKQKKPGEFAAIISQIKRLNPKAKIIVQTLYNPYKDLLFPEFAGYLDAMNSAIINGSSGGKNYMVADVASAFANEEKGSALVNSDNGKIFDPHPTAKGHDVIYTLMAYAATNKLPYNVKSAVEKGKVSAKVSQGNLIITVTPDKGYKTPKSISITISKAAKKIAAMTKGTASIPVADVDADITISGACTK
ncbi:MAG TPA: GDSL-type esterase/lipase family protein [Ruminiclostridium sp.]|nr:GDSL-type esterase/lipase family protein [Ruminiclostridium sp.]